MRALGDLREKIVPFFKENELRTAKKEAFRKFTKILEMMGERKHLSLEGITEIAHVAKTVNSQKMPKFLKSSETIRQRPT